MEVAVVVALLVRTSSGPRLCGLVVVVVVVGVVEEEEEDGDAVDVK